MKLSILVVFGLAIATATIPVASSFAQQSSGNTTNSASSTTVNQNSTLLKTSPSSAPVLEKISDKGHYRVQLKWDSAAFNPGGEFDMQVLFLNASSPHSNATNVVQTESNLTGDSVGPNKTAAVVPGIMDSPLAVDSYDVAIYDGSNHVLFQKLGQPGQASAGGVHVNVGKYTGPVTIAITNIKPATEPGITGTSSTAGPAQTDSVKFSASVAPEFPVAGMVLIGGLGAAIGIWRLSARRQSLT